jgi:penicillin amidase
VKRILVILIVLLVFGAAGGAWWWGRQSLPPFDGELRLDGLAGPVEVLFDKWGVPHVYAAGPEDAWAAAGTLHARDRLWQMELYRRAGSGRLSEVLGAQTLPIDKRLLTLGLRAAAEAEWQAANPAVRTALMRYADGVNAQRARAVGRRKPLEFQLLGFDPAPWTPVDSLVIGRLLAWRLAENHQSELMRYALASRFGAVEANRLAGAYPLDAPTILSQEGSTTSVPAAGPPSLLVTSVPDLLLRGGRRSPGGTEVAGRDGGQVPGLEWLDPVARRGLSNNFVIAPSRTATGRPILANDPHLQIEFPSIWYELHLVAAGLDVMGVTIPGTPFVIIGHNQRIAWGVTNTGADVQDLYLERIDVARQRYLLKGQWLPVEVTRVEIPVRDRQSEPFEVWRTRHGTVFADVADNWKEPPVWLTPAGARDGERRAFALRWDVSGEMAGAFEALDRAATWEEFLASVERFTAPSQNFVFADVDGNIGYAMSGVLPVRAAGSGTAPLDGTTGEGEWIGRVDPSKLPRVRNPRAGYITSSNNEIDRRFSGLITRDWAAPFRASRLHQLLTFTEKWALTNAAQLQTDTVSVAAESIVGGIEGALAAGRSSGASDAALGALENLRTWDRRVDARAVVALYQLFEDALWRRTFMDEMGQELFDTFYEWAGAERPAGLYAILGDPNSRWFDDIATLDRRETRNEVYLLAANDAAERLQRDAGGTNANWTRMHAAIFSHPLSAGGFPLRWLFNGGETLLGGDGTTVNRVSYNRLAPFRAWEIPSWRQVVDVGNWDEALVALPAGQSGHPLSPHYFDQNDLWRQGQYRTQAFTRAAVDKARVHRLLLVPGAQ